MRVRGKPLIAGIVTAAAISMGIAGWAATTPPPPAPSVFLTPPAVGFSEGGIQCVATNASSVNITVVIQVINEVGTVDLDEPPITIPPFRTVLIGDAVTAASFAAPDKCKFTTTSPQALRAGIISADSNGLHSASFSAFPVTIVPPPTTTTTVTQNQQ